MSNIPLQAVYRALGDPCQVCDGLGERLGKYCYVEKRYFTEPWVETAHGGSRVQRYAYFGHCSRCHETVPMEDFPAMACVSYPPHLCWVSDAGAP